MASYNRQHWPSMFKSKPCNSSNIPSPGCEEPSPDPKPRWNPKPEQRRLLEAIFNSGMVSPPRDEIKRITVQLQKYGQVGETNVFYWFQNKKSRNKQKQRYLCNNSKPQTQTPSSSESSERTSSCLNMTNSETHGGFSTDHLLYPIQQTRMNPNGSEPETLKMEQQLGTATNASAIGAAAATSAAPSATPSRVGFIRTNQIEGGPAAAGRSTVFINNVAVQVVAGPFNVREAFGGEALLIHSATGQLVLTNQLGITLQPLQPGQFYYPLCI